ncbi:MAG: hypothetical protein GY797_28295 [Deltaproteobacteria bacterium]|nr:hypothetical protein [Deltaproteobacteria bacterium]
MPIENILKLLEEEFERMAKLFKEDDWKFYKFGQGGPYKRALSILTKDAGNYDKTIIDHFGLSKEVATFRSLITLCLNQAKNPKEEYKEVDSFRRRIQFLRRQV